jgi:hypothetical protein
MPAPHLPYLIVAHVTLAVALFLPSLLLPFTFRPRRRTAGADATLAEPEGGLSRRLLALQARGSVAIGAGVAITGVALVATLGMSVASQPWLLVALAIYALDLGLAFFIQRPNLRRIVGLGAGADERWLALARRQRYVSYVMAGLVGTIAVLMSTKPQLW